MCRRRLSWLSPRAVTSEKILVEVFFLNWRDLRERFVEDRTDTESLLRRGRCPSAALSLPGRIPLAARLENLLNDIVLVG